VRKGRIYKPICNPDMYKVKVYSCIDCTISFG